MENASYNPNIFYFIVKFPGFIGPQGITTILIVLLGGLLCLFIKFVWNRRDNNIFRGLTLKNNVIKIN